jgi:integrase
MPGKDLVMKCNIFKCIVERFLPRQVFTKKEKQQKSKEKERLAELPLAQSSLTSTVTDNTISQNLGKGILVMTAKRKVNVSWIGSKGRWCVSFYWEGYKNGFRKYSWEMPGGQIIPFTEENKGFAFQYADYIRSLMTPDPLTGVYRFDPCKLSKQKKSKYALSKYRETFIKEYRNKVKTGDCSEEYVDLLEGYFLGHIEPLILDEDSKNPSPLGDVSIYELDAVTIKNVYLKLSEKALTKKHIQNIMDAFKMLWKAAKEDYHLDDVNWPKYREKHRTKINKFLLPDEQIKVLSFIEPQHKLMARICLFYGLRSQEAINLKRTDLIFMQGENGKYPALSVKTLKDGPPRVIPIGKATLKGIQAVNPPSLKYLIPYNGKKYSRKTFYKAMRRALDKAGFKDFRPYDATRHSRASQMIMDGASVRDVQDQLGHADIRTSEGYMHIMTSEKWVHKEDVEVVAWKK